MFQNICLPAVKPAWSVSSTLGACGVHRLLRHSEHTAYCFETKVTGLQFAKSAFAFFL